MMKLRLSAVVVLCVAVAGGAFAQAKAAGTTGNAAAKDKGGTVSIEELYLSQEVEVQVLRTQALSNTRETKIMALQNIRQMVEDKRVTADNKEVVTLLQSLAGEGVFRVTRQDGAVANNFPDVRREAVELLGKVGGAEAKITLQKVALEDKEPMVLAEAVYAMGRMATADDKDLMQYLTKVMMRNNARVAPDNNLAFSCLLTIEKLAKTFKGIADPELIGALLDTASGVYLKDVRMKAIQVISALNPKS
jgi:HEAT repeat protein